MYDIDSTWIGTNAHRKAQAWHRNGTNTEFLILTQNEHRIGTKEHQQAQKGTNTKNHTTELLPDI
jgi:hypothetical protein